MSRLVKSCKNVARFLPPDSNVSFHRLPKNKELFRQWLVAIDHENENITWTKGRYVCSEHFAEDDFVPDKAPLHVCDVQASTQYQQQVLVDLLIGLKQSRAVDLALVERRGGYMIIHIQYEKTFDEIPSLLLISNHANPHLEKTFDEIPSLLLSRMLKNVRIKSISTSKYPEELRKFVVTLHFYLAKAYEYVRTTFQFSLPHQSVIRRWSSSVECAPGFSTLCFETVSIKVQEGNDNEKKVVCCLLLDEMSIKKQIDYDGQRFWGYLDHGLDLQDDEVEPAQEALVLMVVCLNASWKLRTAYFLIKTLTAAEKANIVTEALARLTEIGVLVTSITCDGLTAHFKMFQEHGCNFTDIGNLKTFFRNAIAPESFIYAVFDACHMLKLIRNSLANCAVIFDRGGNKIEWKYFTKLYAIQEKETLVLVNLAAPTLSNSVAEAVIPS
ncbi:THAP domain [Popillia japonica]|uniref:THAP domain n=1 Tax=Popillia japonica TaxID=7064 RepID=A0AAW1MGK2_POPJA